MTSTWTKRRRVKSEINRHLQNIVEKQRTHENEMAGMAHDHLPNVGPFNSHALLNDEHEEGSEPFEWPDACSEGQVSYDADEEMSDSDMSKASSAADDPSQPV